MRLLLISSILWVTSRTMKKPDLYVWLEQNSYICDLSLFGNSLPHFLSPDESKQFACDCGDPLISRAACARRSNEMPNCHEIPDLCMREYAILFTETGDRLARMSPFQAIYHQSNYDNHRAIDNSYGVYYNQPTNSATTAAFPSIPEAADTAEEAISQERICVQKQSSGKNSDKAATIPAKNVHITESLPIDSSTPTSTDASSSATPAVVPLPNAAARSAATTAAEQKNFGELLRRRQTVFQQR
ncbi:hypothetical protein NECAME_04737 [Necator americanus]|uniref:Uncharacterized protein n=1 Tax=Necator americanus TaxID=51031 RepID=W2SQR7_NECAM|nr:hypothetical protein NECAME_04737 [Necator americanus]ETN71042.1 hypothetical protein NECAME_04737 [Necator americanus]